MTIIDNLVAQGGPVALIAAEQLVSADGGDIVRPPTFAGQRSGEPAEFNLCQVGDIRIATIDTAGSQANRIEPIFGIEPYTALVPKIEIKAGNKLISLLEAPHRVADAILRYSTLAPRVQEAFTAYLSGDAVSLAKLAPTSLVFGFWDSQGTRAKLRRLLKSTITAYDVYPLEGRAQLFAATRYGELLDQETADLLEQPDNNKLSGIGASDVPARLAHHAVVVRGHIERRSMISLAALRTLGERGPAGDPLRRYILGLALVAITHEHEHTLRDGCDLICDVKHPLSWQLANPRKGFEPAEISHDAALAYAKKAATAFGVGPSLSGEFEPEKLKDALKVANDKKHKAKNGKGKSKRG